jgi:hypothetical protein
MSASVSRTKTEGRASGGSWLYAVLPFATASICLLFGLPVVGQVGGPVGVPLVVEPVEMPTSLFAPSTAAPALDLLNAVELQPLAVLPTASLAAGDQLAALVAWNDAGRLPLKNGFSRPLPLPQRLALNDSTLRVGASSTVAFAGGVLASDGTTFVWAAEIQVEDAYRLRIHLSDVLISSSARLWITGADGVRTGPFGQEVVVDGELWTPSAAGPAVRLELETASRTSLVIDRVLEIVPLDRASAVVDDLNASRLAASAAGPSVADELRRSGLRQSDPASVSAPLELSCLSDARCVTTSYFAPVDLYRKAVAQLQYVKNGDSYLCTGGLLNDTKSSFVPYLLTANHCFSTQSGAASLEAYWDYTTGSCNGQSASVYTRPRSTGSTLLATSKQTDFTLVRLNTVPDNRVFLGWDARSGVVTAGTRLFRISHPAPFGEPLPQSWSESKVTAAPVTCGGTDAEGRPLDDLSKFIRSEKQVGGTFGGSSGGPVLIQGGFVVGQLLGQCGLFGEEGCLLSNQVVDGAFSATYPFISQYLAPATGDTSPCVSSDSTLCLNNGRFEVRVAWQTNAGNNGAGHRQVLTTDTGYFWFFKSTNVEAVIKVLNGCPLNNHYWVFAGGLTNVFARITVRDTTTGAVKAYENPQGKAFQPIQDTEAFATCP